jgi:hypothetical protein
MKPEDSHLWWKQPINLAYRTALNLEESCRDDARERRARATSNLQILEGMGIGGFGAWGYGKAMASAPAFAPPIWNYCAAAVDTLQANIVGGREPKPMLQVTDGSYDDHRQAVWSGRLLEGLYATDQGMYRDLYDVASHGFKLAAGATGTIAVKCLPYEDEGRLVYELRDTLDMFIDAFECSYSLPLTYGDVTWFDPERLCAIFSKPWQKNLILESREELPAEYGGDVGKEPRRMVRFVELWRMKSGKEAGKYLATVKAGGLEMTDYDYSTPPYAFFHARRSLAGFFGVPMIDRVMPIMQRIQQLVRALDKTERLVPKNVAIYDTEMTTPEQVRHMADVMHLPYSSKGRSPGSSEPKFVTVPIYDQTMMNLLERHIQAFHEILGVNAAQMSATKEPGIVAAAAIRTMQDVFTKLFSVVENDWNKFLTKDIGALTLRAVRELSESGVNLEVEWKGGEFMRKVKSNVANLDDKKFTISMQTVSPTRNTPQDRISLADEMLSRQELSPEGYQRVIETGDLPAETRKFKSQSALISKAMDSWMYDELGEISDISPLPWMNPNDAIDQVLDGYIQALMIDDFPVERELYFRRFITQLDAIAQRQAERRARLEALAGGRGGPGAAPAAPIAAE